MLDAVDIRVRVEGGRATLEGEVESRTARYLAGEIVEATGGVLAIDNRLTIRDTEGRLVGTHAGVHRFTVGQRKGLGLSSPIPLYVVGIDAEADTVIVGPRAALERSSLTASNVNWVSGEPPAGDIRVTAQIRHRHREAPATVTPDGADRVRVAFDAPQSAVAPGQALVMYDGERVLGGGWID